MTPLMADEESLGKATLELQATLERFLAQMQAGERGAGRMESKLEALAKIADIAQDELNKVKITDRQAAESAAAGDVIDRKLREINRNANETRRSLDRVRLSGGVPGRSGVGVGVIGSGYGRLGALGTAIGVGALAAPAVTPALGILAGIPTVAAAATGALGTLLLAFQGVGKAISGDEKAFKALQPAQQQLVLTVRSLAGWLDRLRQAAAGSVLPGITAGLKAALSPGTLSAIGKAVAEFGTAIGHAGAELGRYLGSAQFQQIFGPLMAAGARNLGVMAKAAISLFDALGVLGRAAIPLVNWLSDAAAKGAALVDQWLRAKDASGGLSGAMNEAKSSLQLVGGLVEALGRAVVALGTALYPVSRVFVKDLTDGLNALAGMIDRNRGTISELVGGALAALVAAVKVAAPVVGALAKAANGVAKAVGGWKPIFEGIIALTFASKLTAIAGAIAGIGSSAVVTAGEVGGLRAALLGLSAPEVLVGLAGVIATVKLVQNMTKGTTVAPASYGPQLKSGESIANVQNDIVFYRARGLTDDPQYLALVALDKLMQKQGSVVSTDGQVSAALKQANAQAAATSRITGGAGKHAAAAANVRRNARENAAAAEPKPGTHAWYIKYLGFDPSDTSAFGKVPPFTKNVPTVSAATDALSIPLRLQLLEAKANASGLPSAIRKAAISIKQWAEQMVKSGKLTTKQTIDAYNLIASENSTLAALVKKTHEKIKAAPELISEHGKGMNDLTKALKKKTTDAIKNAAADEAQFLSDFARIVQAYAPNAFQTQPSNAKTNTHLHELVTETRETNRHLRTLTDRTAFPGSAYALTATEAAIG